RMIEFRRDRLCECGVEAIGGGGGGIEQGTPTRNRERVGALERETGTGEMQLRERLADRGAMVRARPANPHAVEEGDDRGGPAGETAEHFAMAVLDRLRT